MTRKPSLETASSVLIYKLCLFPLIVTPLGAPCAAQHWCCRHLSLGRAGCCSCEPRKGSSAHQHTGLWMGTQPEITSNTDLLGHCWAPCNQVLEETAVQGQQILQRQPWARAGRASQLLGGTSWEESHLAIFSVSFFSISCKIKG